jgi:hypothetical protein
MPSDVRVQDRDGRRQSQRYWDYLAVVADRSHDLEPLDHMKGPGERVEDQQLVRCDQEPHGRAGGAVVRLRRERMP